jgi:hypothetical protein
LPNVSIVVQPVAEPDNFCAICCYPAMLEKQDHRVLQQACTDGAIEHDTQWVNALFSDRL